MTPIRPPATEPSTEPLVNHQRLGAELADGELSTAQSVPTVSPAEQLAGKHPAVFEAAPAEEAFTQPAVIEPPAVELPTDLQPAPRVSQQISGQPDTRAPSTEALASASLPNQSPVTEPATQQPVTVAAIAQPLPIVASSGELAPTPAPVDLAPAAAPVVPHPLAYRRFNLAQRLEHVLAIGSFTLLAVTGLPQMLAAHGWALAMIGFFGGIEVTRDIHHFAAIVLMLEVVWHLVSLGYRLYVRRARPTMLPGARDVTDAWGTLLYNMGLRKQRPLTGRYSFEEKVEYWAFVWGTVIMAITGFMMWNPIATAQLLPGEFIPAAKAAHGNEAVLAVLAIIVWHLYSVHIRRFNKSMWTGNLTASEMSEEHPLELADIQAGRAQPQLDPVTLRKRQRIYGLVAGVLALVFVFGVYEFATFESTVIDTVPLRVIQAAQVQAFVPLTPTPLPRPQLSPVPASLKPIWDGNIDLLLAHNCGSCHGGLAGLDLSSYASTLSGGQNGPTILAGDPDHSPLLQRIKDGTHPGKLIAAHLSKLKAWIAAGAPER